MYAQRRFISACAFAQSKQNLHWAHLDSHGCKVFFLCFYFLFIYLFFFFYFFFFFVPITKSYLYNFDPIKPNFYIVKLRLQGYTLFFLFLLKNIDCGYSLEPPRRVPTIYVLSRNRKNIRIFI